MLTKDSNRTTTGARLYALRVLLSDRDIRAAIDDGRLGIDPFDDALVQPSSVDVRLDSLFRVFNNTRYTHIDPARQQDELTTLAAPDEGEPFVLHPGEFVLGVGLRATGACWGAGFEARRFGGGPVRYTNLTRPAIALV